MPCWGPPVSSSMNIKDEWGLADSFFLFLFLTDAHKAQLNIISVLLLCASPNRCDPSTQCAIWQDRGWAVVVVGLWSTSSLIPPTLKTLFKNKRLFGQSQSPGAWGSSAFLPRLSSPLFLPEFFKASAFLCLLGQDIKQDPRGSDCQPDIPHKRKTYTHYSQISGLPY